MKLLHVNKLSLLFFTLIIALGGHAQDNYELKSAKASIQGTSSLHDWESELTNLQAVGLFHVKNGVLQNVKSVEIKIPVKGIKSTKGKMMDNKTYDAFKSDKNPYIIYVLGSNQVKINAENVASVDASGSLTMAGTSKQIELTANVSVLANGDLQVSVSRKIKMTDYKMKQPTAMLGSITVGDEVTVNFVLVLSPVIAQAKKV